MGRTKVYHAGSRAERNRLSSKVSKEVKLSRRLYLATEVEECLEELDSLEAVLNREESSSSSSYLHLQSIDTRPLSYPIIASNYR